MPRTGKLAEKQGRTFDRGLRKRSMFFLDTVASASVGFIITSSQEPHDASVVTGF